MRYISLIILLLIFNSSFAQIELIKKAKNYSIGQINSDYESIIRLGYNEMNNENEYYLSVIRKHQNTCGKDSYNLKFLGQQKDLDLLYNLILDAYNGSGTTEIKIGDKVVSIGENLFRQSTANKANIVNLHKDFYVNGCSMFAITEKELRLLFNK